MHRRLVFVGLLALVLSVPLAAKPPKGGTTGNTIPILSLATAKWVDLGCIVVNGSKTCGNVIPLGNDADGSLYVDVPVGEDYGPSINYVFSKLGSWSGTKGTLANISGYSALSMTLRLLTTEAPIFHYKFEDGNTCQYPAHVRPFIWSRYDSYADGSRWWAIDPNSYELVAGATETTLVVPLDPTQWSGVYGERASDALAWWNDALTHVSSIGVTFGGGCFYGHGVNESGGTARFVIADYRLQ
jgi:hypothetical protein